MTTALIKIMKRIYLNSSDFFIPITTITKYPILLTSLIKRIKDIKERYSLSNDIHIYNLDTDKAKAQSELSNKGGVYVLWCKSSGMFYVGSALRFFMNKGRLTDYFMPGRVKASLEGNSTKVSKDLAQAISTYGIENFTLLIPQLGISSDLNKAIIQNWEQLWMMLNPTLNRSLMVSSNSGTMMSEEDRMKISTMIYQYEIDSNNAIIPNTEKILFGLKETSRIGITSFNNTHYSIQYDTLKGHYDNKMIWVPSEHKFYFSDEPLTNNFILTSLNINAELSDKRSQGIWVYDANTKELLSYESSVKECEMKYNISRTHLKRVRKYNQIYQGKLFSNYKL